MTPERPRSTLSLKREARKESNVEERLHKVLANAGLGSRRLLEERIEAGEIRVNGEVANLGSSLRAGDRVEVDGKAFVSVATEPEEIELAIYHKPEGEVTTHDDPEGRKTVFERLPRLKGARWVSVGRLDINTTGLLLVTTDGELANALMHPSREVEREYVVRIQGEVQPEVLDKLKQGVELEDGVARFDDVAVINLGESHSWFRVTLKEGRNREVRRMWEAVGLNVSRLKRIRYGSIELPRDLRRGHYRQLEQDTIRGLRRELGLAEAPQTLTLQAVIGVRRAAKSTEFRPDQRSQRAWAGGSQDEARELRAFDHVREDRPARKGPGGRGKKRGPGGPGGGARRGGGGYAGQGQATAPGGVPAKRRTRGGGPGPGEAWTPNVAELRSWTANEKGPRTGGGAGRGGPGGARSGGPGRSGPGGRGAPGGGGGRGAPGGGGQRRGQAATPYGFPSDHAYAQRDAGPRGPRGPSRGPRGPGGNEAPRGARSGGAPRGANSGNRAPGGPGGRGPGSGNRGPGGPRGARGPGGPGGAPGGGRRGRGGGGPGGGGNRGPR